MTPRGRRASPRSSGVLSAKAPAMEPLPFAFEFEESDFESGDCREKERRRLSLPAYSARQCEPKWFCEETVCGDEAEMVNIKKFRGDLAYKQREFKKALDEYSDCLSLLPPSNLAMRRDVQESQVRCLANLGRQKEALGIAEILKNGATNTDHATVVLGLQLAIYRSLEHMEKIIRCLQQLIFLHPFHPRHWKLLAEAYMSHSCFPAPLPLSEANLLQGYDLTANTCPRVVTNEAEFQCLEKQPRRKGFSLQFSYKCNGSFEFCEECQKLERPDGVLEKPEGRHAAKKTTLDYVGWEASEDILIYACASLVRARLLYQLEQSSQSSFALESNLKAQQEIGDQIKCFGLKERVLSLMTEAMGEDLVPEKLKEDIQGEVKCLSPSALTSIMTVSPIEFEKKWFQKLKDNLSQLNFQT